MYLPLILLTALTLLLAPPASAPATPAESTEPVPAPANAVSRKTTPDYRGKHRRAHPAIPTEAPVVFPKWTPSASAPADLRTELRLLLAQGRRDQAASPEFLDALQQLLDRHAADAPAPPPPSDRLPFRPDFASSVMPPGWSAIKPEVWSFGGGYATQIRSWADSRFVLSYDPGCAWRDYLVTFTVESDSWYTPPARSSAVLYFRYHSPSDAFSLWLDSAGDITLASLETGEKQRILARVPVDSAVIRDGKPWTVTVRGEEIKVHHEGRCLLMATDPAHPTGTIGLESVHVPARFSAVSVAGIPR